METPYEIKDPIEFDPTSEYLNRDLLQKRTTGRKVTAVIDEPRNCYSCMFSWYRWISARWAKATNAMKYKNKPGTQAVGCMLAKQGTLTVLDYDDQDFKPRWCPLVHVECGDAQ